jgi:hypothetical protein
MYSRGTAVQSIAGHLAAKVPDAAAPNSFMPVRQTECTGAAYIFDFQKQSHFVAAFLFGEKRR